MFVHPFFMFFFFFFNDTATTEIYTLSLHDALPISPTYDARTSTSGGDEAPERRTSERSEEHTSELQSRQYLVCRLLLEQKKYFACPKPTHTRKNKGTRIVVRYS